MASDLLFGSVPQFYREVYDIVCPDQQQVDRDMFVSLLVKSSLPKHVLTQIWDLVDTKVGYLTRNGLYKALALTALAQQGKPLNEKILETYTDQELPKPLLGDISDLKALSVKVRRDRNPNVLSYRYHELCELDTIKVELVPEKKGLILKHVEYEVTSQRYKVTVLRRYNDFLALHELLLQRFPYRMVPRLPPKKMMGVSREFIEHRRKALRRYINLIARHPVMTDDRMLKFFLSFSGADMQYKIKEHFRGMPDEFMTNENALKAKDLVPMDTQLQFGNTKEHIRILHQSLTKVRDIADRMVARSTEEANDMLYLGKELSSLSSDSTVLTSWATGANNTWSQLKAGFKKICIEFAAISDKSAEKAKREDELVSEVVNILLDLVVAYRDLCERHEKGVLNDHQRALQKMGQYKKKKMSATVGSTESAAVEQLEQRILQQESQISNMENRNYFSLHCLQMEAQLIHANLDILYTILQNIANIQSKSYTELGHAWCHLLPIVEAILPRMNGSDATSPTSSPPLSPKHAGGITV
ncbi:sorting nexin-8-like isoform X2 [Lineus longissimus]|uniref:sorting nexin-8-like isoform X2 n=1 Tax=Lineus longissimus TaxID=88925 RepID=UPI00315D5BEC